MTTLAEIAHAVCFHMRVSEEQLYRRTRGGAEAAEARMVFYWLCHELTEKSWPQIAQAVGRRCHTTCLKGARKVDTRMATNDQFYSEVMAIKREFL